MRTRTLLLLATTLTVATIAGVGVAAGGAATPERSWPDAHPAVSNVARASRVLAEWDHARAVAWARGDVTALARLYTPSSAAGARDAADLREWRHCGLRVTGLRQQVAELRVLAVGPRRLVVRATDRTVDAVAVAVGEHRRTALPISAWRSHRIRLVLRHGRWVVDEAEAQPAR
jgi:hypothetical protein